MSSTEPTGHLLTVLALAQITLADVIVKGHTKIMKKQQVILLVFLQSVQQRCFFLCSPSETGGVLFALMSGECEQFVKACFQTKERLMRDFLGTVKSFL